MTPRNATPVLALLAAAACATARQPPAPLRQVEAGLPAAAELSEGADREAFAAARVHEAKGDAAGLAKDLARTEWATAAAGYLDVAARPGGAAHRVPLRGRAAELLLRAQRWDRAAEAAGQVGSEPDASEATRAVGARLVATAWLGAANDAVKAGQLEKLDLGPERKDPRPVAPGWRRVVEATDAYLARAGADPELRRASAGRPSGPDLALIAAEVQLSHGELDDARRRLDAALDRFPGDPDLLEQAVPLYLVTYAARGDRAGQAAAADRLRERVDAEAVRATGDRRAALARVQELLGRARAGVRFAQGEDLLKQGKAADAARAFEDAAAEPGAPDRAAALHNAGVAWDQAGDAAAAAAARVRLLKDHPDAAVTGEDALRLAGYKARQGDHLGAARLYEDFLRRWGDSPSRCVALRNVAAELDRADRGADAAARYLAFGQDGGCAKADPDIAARALVRAGRLLEEQAKVAYAGAASLEGVSDPEAKSQVAEAKKRLKGP